MEESAWCLAPSRGPGVARVVSLPLLVPGLLDGPWSAILTEIS